MKEQFRTLLTQASFEVVDFGNTTYDNDDYPDFPFPVAQAVAEGQVDGGVLICGSGVGACVAANKVHGVRAALCHDDFSARQGVEDGDMNVISLNGRTMGIAVEWDCTRNFLDARFTGAERHRRRLAKVAQAEESLASRGN